MLLKNRIYFGEKWPTCRNVDLTICHAYWHRLPGLDRQLSDTVLLTGTRGIHTLSNTCTVASACSQTLHCKVVLNNVQLQQNENFALASVLWKFNSQLSFIIYYRRTTVKPSSPTVYTYEVCNVDIPTCGMRWYPKLCMSENSSGSLRERMKAELSKVPRTTGSFLRSRIPPFGCSILWGKREQRGGRELRKKGETGRKLHRQGWKVTRA